MKIFKAAPAILALIIYVILLSIGIWGNPFSNDSIKGVYKSINKNELMDPENINSDEPYGNLKNREVRGISERYYVHEGNRVKVVLGKKKFESSSDTFEPIMQCESNQYHIVNIADDEDQKCASQKDVQDPNIHPLPAFSNVIMDGENNFMLLGTIADQEFESGIDRLSYLSNSIFQSTKLSFFSSMCICYRCLIFNLF